MDCKKALIGTLGGTVLGAGIAGIKGLEKGLELGVTIGFVAGITLGVVGSSIFVLGKNKIKGRCA